MVNHSACKLQAALRVFFDWVVVFGHRFCHNNSFSLHLFQIASLASTCQSSQKCSSRFTKRERCVNYYESTYESSRWEDTCHSPFVVGWYDPISSLQSFFFTHEIIFTTFLTFNYLLDLSSPGGGVQQLFNEKCMSMQQSKK